jgi:hypothetical protein
MCTGELASDLGATKGRRLARQLEPSDKMTGKTSWGKHHMI